MKGININDAYELFSVPHKDERGFFLNIFRSNTSDFQKLLNGSEIVQINLSFNEKIGTIRGLHYQKEPYAEAKIVRCLKGKVWDVVVDLRYHSSTYLRWSAVELSPEKSNSLFIPRGCAHGFQVLKPKSELLYLHSGKWMPEFETGLRWDDKILSIDWPLPFTNISQKDKDLPYLEK